MSHPAPSDRSNGYDAAADEFMLQRSTSIGVDPVQLWARNLPPRAAVLDLGCWNGIPIAQTLAAWGFVIYGVDASPRMIAGLRRNVPGVVAECGAVEDSSFFDRTFDGVIDFFTAPHQDYKWTDVITGRTSVSLGQGYHRMKLTWVACAQ